MLRKPRSGACGFPGAIRLRGNASPVANVQATDPEDDVFGDIRGMVGDTLQMARGQNELQTWTDQRGLPAHAFKQFFENLVTVLIHDVVALKNLGGRDGVPKDERPETFADH